MTTFSRRTFVRTTTLAATGLAFKSWAEEKIMERPLFVSTWDFGKHCNDAALKTVQEGGSLLDAIERGIWVAEADAANTSVGLGGTPNAQGKVQLDACIMNSAHEAGSVAALEGILHPISVARRVMEQTPHVLLAGDGARQFALEQGFEHTELLTEERKKAWVEWQQKQYTDEKNHDTIALLALGADGNISGGCSTSGWGYKLPGRVGDSPIIGSGLYVDNQVGAAGATGLGENVMRYCASFLIVEFMRQGMAPTEACLKAIERIEHYEPKGKELSLNFVALAKDGRYGAAGTDKGFQYAVTSPTKSEVLSGTR